MQSQGSAKSSHLSRIGFKSYKKKKVDPKILLPSDLVGDIFEQMDDIE